MDCCEGGMLDSDDNPIQSDTKEMSPATSMAEQLGRSTCQSSNVAGGKQRCWPHCYMLNLGSKTTHNRSMQSVTVLTVAVYSDWSLDVILHATPSRLMAYHNYADIA